MLLTYSPLTGETGRKFMSLYRNILKQAWRITWHNKYLWFFGIFAALLGSSGEYEMLWRQLSNDGGQTTPIFQQVAQTGVFSRQVFSNLTQIMTEDAMSLLLVLLIGLAILVLFIFTVWLVIISQIAIVNNAAAIIDKKKINFQAGINNGLKNFWPVLGLNILVKAIIYVIFLIISLPIILSTDMTSVLTANFLYIVAFIIFIPVVFALSFIIKYAIAYVVIRRSNFIDSLKQGWRLFIDNWLISLEMAFILFFINLAVGFTAIISILILAIPFLFLGFIFYYLASFIGFWLIVILAGICLLLIIILSGAILSVFQIGSWISLFVELINNGGKSKLIRVVEKIYK